MVSTDGKEVTKLPPDYWEISSWEWWPGGYGPLPEWLKEKGG